MFLSKKEKEKRVIELAQKGKTTREIAKEVHISLKDISRILKKVTGDDETEKEQRLKDKSEYAKAFKMFKDGLPLEGVAIELDIETPIVLCYYRDYLKLVNMGRLATVYKELKGDLSLFLQLYGRIKKERLSRSQISELLEMPNLLLDLKEKVDLYKTTYGIFIQKKSEWKRR